MPGSLFMETFSFSSFVSYRLQCEVIQTAIYMRRNVIRCYGVAGLYNCIHAINVPVNYAGSVNKALESDERGFDLGLSVLMVNNSC